jgi:hypothetical protein
VLLLLQRLPLCEVASVSQRDRALRHDTLDSDAGNLPKAKAGLPAADSKPLLAVCKLARILNFLFRRAVRDFRIHSALFFSRIYARLDCRYLNYPMRYLLTHFLFVYSN